MAPESRSRTMAVCKHNRDWCNAVFPSLIETVRARARVGTFSVCGVPFCVSAAFAGAACAGAGAGSPEKSHKNVAHCASNASVMCKLCTNCVRARECPIYPITVWQNACCRNMHLLLAPLWKCAHKSHAHTHARETQLNRWNSLPCLAGVQHHCMAL